MYINLQSVLHLFKDFKVETAANGIDKTETTKIKIT